MNTDHQEQLAHSENSRWHTCAILFWGTFGTKSPAERRYVMRSIFAATVVMVLVVLTFSDRFPPKPIVMKITLLATGALITYIAWELYRYLSQLDELARRMQMEAITWTYLTGFVAAAWIGVLAPFSHFLMHWPYKPSLLTLIPFLYFVLEPVRAVWLYVLSRRY